MIRNYFILAFRNFRKHKVFSLINVLGLAVGISASLVIYLIVQYEFSFDRFHKDGDRIYRVVSNLNFSGKTFDNSGVPAPLRTEAGTAIPGIEVAAGFYTMYQPRVSIHKSGTEKPAVFRERKGVIFADQHYFNLFAYQWLAGSPDVLKGPSVVVLSESRAKEYFPVGDATKAVGQVMMYDDSIAVTVAGIVKDLDQVTDLTFKEFIALSTIPARNLGNNYSWDVWNNYYGSSQFFVKLKKEVSPQQTAAQITALITKHAPNSALFTASHSLQPLYDLHFNSKYEIFGQRRADKPTLYGLLLVAAFLLILGCINFINLTTAQAAQRAREIGIRKTMGSTRRQLVAQFLNETLALTIIATLLSIALMPLLLKAFADYIPEGVTFSRIIEPNIITFIIALVVIVSLLAGFYPSLVLSKFKPVLVLKNQTSGNTGKTRSAWLRKTLTVSQFIIAQFFIIGTLMVSQQIYYSLHKDLGYRKDAIITFTIPWREASTAKKQVLLQKLQNIPEIQQVSLSGIPPATKATSSSTLTFDDGQKTIDRQTEIRIGDAAYFDLYKIKLVAGKMLLPSDTARKEYLVNEAYARDMGYTNPADIVDKHIHGRDKSMLPIVGVVADFHTKSLHEAITPLVFTAKSKEAGSFHILLQPREAGSDTWKRAIDKIEKALKEVHPDRSFDYSFFDEQIAEFYEAEQRTSRLLTWASGLAILISCLGLLGLVMYTTHQRVKEIGVRKVLGASVTQIVSLLSKDFIVLVILAFVITAPLAWWASNAWLQNFAYRTSIPWWIFAMGGGMMIMIALLTLSIQTIRAALANPVKALRSE
ncbi:FtsX-like permease family protein [Pseudoflavitalea sp. X16]|uniref:ABC transporter permease n=1 Tax=Paraflavitalea devenefica TaxID=2716334 RepID=UPI001421047A|nr:ABC transporter permease [Paraflavitalea devenefica]NII28028.1 FtsX-like permease family protein [Paraflavitalea devenefica]